MKWLDKEKKIKILFLDNHVLVVDKPIDIATQTDKFNAKSIQSEAQRWIKEKFNKIGNVFVQFIHRLDKDVSGIIVLAKTSKALSRLNEQQKQKRIIKIYEAIIPGSINPKMGRLTHWIRKDNFKAAIFDKYIPNSKKACLYYNVIAEGFNSRILIYLYTGRYHQIRAQFSAVGKPIIGDDKYGGSKTKRLYLHHKEIAFLHPITSQLMRFKSENNF